MLSKTVRRIGGGCWPGIVGLLCLVPVSSCSGGNVEQMEVREAPASQDQAQLDSLRQRISALRSRVQAQVADPVATSLESCRAMPFGAKPCGGPWTYIVYSTEVADSTELEEIVARYNAVEAELNHRTGQTSDCAVVAPPRLTWDGSRCLVEDH